MSSRIRVGGRRGKRRSTDTSEPQALVFHRCAGIRTFDIHSPESMLDIINLDSLEALARERLDPMLFDYIAGGAGDEWTLAENRAAWSRYPAAAAHAARCRRAVARDDGAGHAGVDAGSRAADGLPRTLSPRRRGSHGARAPPRRRRSSARALSRTRASRRSRRRRTGRDGSSCMSIATGRSREGSSSAQRPPATRRSA